MTHLYINCRNYLDYVEESVSDWLKEEEAKYQAQMLSMELEKMRMEEEAASRASERANKKGKKGSASKSVLLFIISLKFAVFLFGIGFKSLFMGISGLLLVLFVLFKEITVEIFDYTPTNLALVVYTLRGRDQTKLQYSGDCLQSSMVMTLILLKFPNDKSNKPFVIVIIKISLFTNNFVPATRQNVGVLTTFSDFFFKFFIFLIFH